MPWPACARRDAVRNFEWHTRSLFNRNGDDVLPVSFRDSAGTEHAVTVEAETLFEAVGVA
jgi:hypothetical protein